MAYGFERTEDVETGLTRIAGEQIRKAIEEIGDSKLDATRTVHQVRKRCKKVRGLLRLVRSSFAGDYSAENALFRDLARGLAPVRDADVRLATLDQLLSDKRPEAKPQHLEEGLGTLRDLLERDRERAASDLEARLAKAGERLQHALDRSRSWSLADNTGYSALSGGLRKTYRRGRKAMARALEDPIPELLHEWRKRAKYHWQHLRLLEPSWPEVLGPQGRAASELGDVLGVDHDLAELRRQLTALQPRSGAGAEAWGQACLLAIDRQRKECQARARDLGRRVFAEPPRGLRRRLQGYWQAWRATRPARAGSGSPAGCG